MLLVEGFRMQLTAGQKNLVNKTVDVSTFAIRWGFVPLIVYLGFKQGPDPMPNGQVCVVFFTFFLGFYDTVDRYFCGGNSIVE